MKGVMKVVLTTLVMVGFMVYQSEAITCVDVDNLLKPCLTFLRSAGGTPPEECCKGVKDLEAECTTTSDRQTACGCAKAAAMRLQIIPDQAKALPNACGITTTIPITPDVDCSTVSFYERYNLRVLKLPDLL